MPADKPVADEGTLAPCPFCGRNQPRRGIHGPRVAPLVSGCWCVRCWCGASTPHYVTKGAARNFWNRRKHHG